ncbi:MAG TPA: diphthine--ammonia ligase [Candidatus Woesearchaeota archaeon]|nr:MAG: diphthine--ammonia ligase [Candidatus Woesearchaeota archaeon]HDD70921.1 diphthine--ammonia ligase [Candidatus Woesearchaeota archaeon]
MRVGILFSGGKDSTFAAFLAKKNDYDISCLISVVSENPFSFMFHTPSISQISKQAESIGVPLIIEKTAGEKELELAALEKCIRTAVEKYSIEGVVTGAVESVYQASRIQKICNRLSIECFNPLWQKDQLELLDDLLKNGFDVIITGIAAFPLDESWLGRKIDRQFIGEVRSLSEKFKINPAGEGGEFESFVLDCPLFKRKLNVKDSRVVSFGEFHKVLEVVIE